MAAKQLPVLLALVALSICAVNGQSFPRWERVNLGSSTVIPRAYHMTAMNSSHVMFLGGQTSDTTYPETNMAYSIADGVITSGISQPLSTNTHLPTTYLLSRNAWTQVPGTGKAWSFSGRDPAGNYQFIFAEYDVGTNYIRGIPQQSAQAPPPGRELASGAWLTRCYQNTTTGNIEPCFVFFGGLRGTAGSPAQVWQATATQLLTSPGGPTAGFGGPGVLWRVQTIPNSPTPRWSTMAGVSPAGDVLYLIGGDTAGGPTNEVWAYAPFGFTDVRAGEYDNVARPTVNPAVRAFQSSTRSGGASSWATNAIDGNADVNWNNGRCTHNDLNAPNTTSPWWMIDLGSTMTIANIRITQRADCCRGRFAGYELYASNTRTSAEWAAPLGANHWRIPTPSADILAFYADHPASAGMQARYIWVRLPGPGRFLSICEFEVWRRRINVWRQLSGTYNAALGKEAFASSKDNNAEENQFAGGANFAVDGDTNQGTSWFKTSTRVWPNGPTPAPRIFWYVDLGFVHDITSLEYWVRSGGTQRRTRYEAYIGNSRNFEGCTRCWGPSDQLFNVSTSLTIPCAGRGRFVHFRRVPLQGDSASDANVLEGSEIRVFANRLTNQPAPRSGAAYSTYGGYLVMFGGRDTAGVQLNDVRLFDLVNGVWLPPVTVYGTPPLARSFSSLTLLPDVLPSGSTIAYPSANMLLFGGVGQEGALGDMAMLRFAKCPPLSNPSFSSLTCSHGDTVCYYTCFQGAAAHANDGRPLRCGLDGKWIGIAPYCVDNARTPPNVPSAGMSVTPAPNNATFNFRAVVIDSVAVSQGIPQITKYRVKALTRGYVQQFTSSGFFDSADWELHNRYPNVAADAYGFNERSMWANLEAGANLDCWGALQSCFGIYRPVPTEAVGNIEGNWAIESYVSFATGTTYVPLDNQMYGIALFDVNETSRTFNTAFRNTHRGCAELWGGIRRANGAYTIGWSASCSTRFSQFITDSRATQAFIRLERIWNPNPRLRAWRFGYKFAAKDAFTYTYPQLEDMLARGWNNWDAEALPAAHLRVGFTGKNTQSLRIRSYAEFSYFRISPIDCADTGPEVEVAQPAGAVHATTPIAVVIPGLEGGASYSFSVTAYNGLTWSALPTVFPSSGLITLPALPPPDINIAGLVEVARNKPVIASSTNSASQAPAMAVNGNPSDFYLSFNSNAAGEWLQIDLGLQTAIKQLTIYNRPGENPSISWVMNRWRGTQVFVSATTSYTDAPQCTDTPSNITTGEGGAAWMWNGTALMVQDLTSPGVVWRAYDPWRDFKATFNCSLTGRYVTFRAPPNLGVQGSDGYLSLREVEVYAANSCPFRNATNADIVGGSVCTGGRLGSVCSYRCKPGFVPVAGEATSVCNGEEWDFPELVCAPTCPQITQPGFTDTCMRSIFSETFDAVAVAADKQAAATVLSSRWLSVSPSTQAFNDKFFILPTGEPNDGQLSASAIVGCNNELYAMITDAKVTDHRDAFELSATIATKDRAGLVFRSIDRSNMYRVVADLVTYVVSLDAILDGVPTRLNDVRVSNQVLQDSRPFVLKVAMSGPQITVSLDDNYLFDSLILDRSLLAGAAGVYAATNATFDDVQFRVPCNGAVLGATDGDVVSFTCQPGLLGNGPLARTCVNNPGGVTADWVPALSTATECSLAPPLMVPQVLFVRENSIRNTLVGNPIAASVESPDFQLQYKIDACSTIPAGRCDANTPFFIDACSGQVKLRAAVLDFEALNTYTLSVRAFVPEFPSAFRVTSYTVTVQDVDEAPVITPTTCFLPENSGPGTFVCRVPAWDPENDTITLNVDVRSPGGVHYSLDRTTGEIHVVNTTRIGDLNFESSTTNRVDLVISATQVSNPSLIASAKITIALLDRNDAPVLVPGQALLLDESDTINVPNAPFPTPVAATDEDASAPAPSFTLLSPSECGISEKFGTVDGQSTGTSLFTLSTSGTLTLVALPTGQGITTRYNQMTADPYSALGTLVHADYEICVNVSDGRGWTSGVVAVGIKAQAVTVPVLMALQSGSSTISTLGGDVHVFTGQGFGAASVATYSNGVLNYTGSCAAIDAATLACTTVPGVGSGFKWVITVGLKRAVDVAQFTFSYESPSVRNVNNHTGIATTGGRLLEFNGTGFGPAGTPVTITYGPVDNPTRFPCTHSQVPSLSHTRVYCFASAGAGADLRWVLTVGGQSTVSSSSDNTQWISYAPPTVTNVSGLAGVDIKALSTRGGQQVVISGSNFGPAGVGIHFTAQYGGPTGNALTFSSCLQGTGAAAHTTITCNTVPGVGVQHKVSVIVEGVPSASVWPAGADGFTYARPNVTAVTGAGITAMDTAGGSTISVQGMGFGPAAWPEIPLVTYGKPGDVGRYTATGCTITTAVGDALDTITCSSAPGIGRGHSLVLTAGTQASNTFASQLGYAAPQIFFFSGDGAEGADTRGGNTVLLTGRNFGPSDLYTLERMNVTYSTELRNGPGSLTQLLLRPSSCVHQTPHTELLCTVAEGAGKDLSWSILLDSVQSRNPSTSYHEPIITDIVDEATQQPVTAANVDGGDVVHVRGDFFGPMAYHSTGLPLIQSVTFGSTGTEYVVPSTNWQLVSPGHSTIRVVLPPGAGSNLKFRVAVADQYSPPSAATFSYARIAVARLLPATANTFSDPFLPTVITVQARNVPLRDPLSRIELMFGNGAFAQRLPLVVPQGAQSIAQATNMDGTVNLTFTLPRDGAGLQLAVRLDVVSASSPSGSPPSVSSEVTRDSLFSYNPPVVTDVILTLPKFLPANYSQEEAATGVPCPFLAGDAMWSCSSPDVLQLTILGSNFGGNPSTMQRQDGVTRKLELQLFDDGISQVWDDERLWLADNGYSHSRITVYTTRATGVVRLTLTSTAYDGQTLTQSVLANYADRSPDVGSVVGAVNNIPTVGGTPLTLEVSNLARADDVEVTVGGNVATLYRTFADAQAGVNPLATDAARKQYIEDRTIELQNNPPADPDVYYLHLRIPAGQGTGNRIVLYRIKTTPSLRRDASNDNAQVNYAAPDVTGLNLLIGTTVLPPNSIGVTDVSDPTFRFVAPTDGTARVRVTGTNLGASPTLVIGDGYTVPTTPCTGTAGAEHKCVEAAVPAGEGNGRSFYGSFGYRLQLLAGNNQASPLRFEYEPPTVNTITSETGELPTRGNVTITLVGANFGERAAARPTDTYLAVTFTDASGGQTLDCSNVVRISHTHMNCTLPEGSGRDLDVIVYVADTPGRRSTSKLTYNPPTITSASISNGITMAVTGYTHPALRGNTTGGDIITLTGRNFGRNDSAVNCAFLMWINSAPGERLACDRVENFLGEGEVDPSYFIQWSHEQVSFAVPPGLGHKQVQLSIRGNMLAAVPTDASALLFRYLPPSLEVARPASGEDLDTEGGETVRIIGTNMGPAPRNTSRADQRLNSNNFRYLPGGGIPLVEAGGLPTAYVVITFHRACITAANDLQGRRPDTPSLDLWYGSSIFRTCSESVLSQTHGQVSFLSTAGIGRDRLVVVHVVDAVDGIVETSNPATISYHAPEIQSFSPSVVYMSGSESGSVDILGRYFGNDEQADRQGWTAEERVVAGTIGGYDCTDTRRRRENGETVLKCEIDLSTLPAGYRNVSVLVAGQVGVKDATPSGRTLLLVCAPGYYGRVNETCLPCPANSEDPARRGAECKGYIASVSEFEARFTYPRPLKGWYNLNSSDAYTEKLSGNPSMILICPAGFRDADRDVCVVPCDPPESCLGDNWCAEGYTSKAPMFRCASCDKGFYKRSGECVKCPDSPGALFIGFILLVIVVATVGFFLNKKQINIAVISIGVDFFQVLAIFAQARIKWPPVVKELLHILSAFNLNIEIVAPECLIPDVSYKQKFWFIMLLPLCIAGLFGVSYVGLGAYKALVLGQPKKLVWNHHPTLVSSVLVLLYLLYLYLTRTIFDVFNCGPTFPPDGKNYLQVVFEECGIPGGTQLTLMPFAIAGLAVYTAGYPVFIGWTLYSNRELVMEDQLLRAKGTGNDKLSNPRAYDFRMTYGRSYFQFKPDWCMWILAIVLRKFFIAITAVVFGKNSSFQMAACLLIMFLAYAAQVQIRPYMSAGDFEEVLSSHVTSSYTSAIHARLRASIAGIESRGRKKAHKNLINFEGKVDRAAVLGLLTGFFFNYNTVEAIMSFCAVIVCLMAIMYQANELNSYYPESRDSVTSVTLIIIIWAIVYFFTVFITEIVVLYNEDQRATQLAKAARGKASKKGSDFESGSSSGGKRVEKLVDGEGELNLGKVETATNPMFLKADGGAAISGSSNSDSTIEAILSQSDAPPVELWRVFQQAFSDMQSANNTLKDQLQQARKQLQTGSGAGASGASDEMQSVRAVGKAKTQFAPKSADSSSNTNPLALSGGGRGGGVSLASMRKSSRNAAASPSSSTD